MRFYTLLFTIGVNGINDIRYSASRRFKNVQSENEL